MQTCKYMCFVFIFFFVAYSQLKVLIFVLCIIISQKKNYKCNYSFIRQNYTKKVICLFVKYFLNMYIHICICKYVYSNKFSIQIIFKLQFFSKNANKNLFLAFFFLIFMYYTYQIEMILLKQKNNLSQV